MISPHHMQAVLIYNVDPTWDPETQAATERESRRLGHAIRRQGRSLALSPIRSSHLAHALAAYDPKSTVVINWCEALPGMDRSETQVPSILDALNFTYTGATAEVIALSYDKPRVKAILAEGGIPTPDWVVDDGHQPLDGWTRFPAIVKPAMEHCSLGMDSRSVVTNRDELVNQAARVRGAFEQPALIEDFIDGREFHVSVWGNGRLEMLPPVEMDFSAMARVNDRVCSYDAKFVADSAAYRGIRTVIPARLTADEREALERVCLGAYRAIGCRDYGRIDVRLRDGIFYVLDVNPNADISADASIAVAAEKTGLCYGAVGVRLLDLAAHRGFAD